MREGRDGITQPSSLFSLARRDRDVLYRDIREALRFSQRAFNERRYDDARQWAYTAEAKANTLRLAAERAARDA